MPDEVKRWYPRFAGVAHPEVENAVRIILDKVYAERELTRELEERVNHKIRGLSGTFGSHAVRGELQTGGRTPLNVEGLLGKLAQPQIGGAAVGTATPKVDDPVSQDGALFVLNPTRSLYYFDGSSEPGTWRTLAAAGVLPAGLRSAKPAAGNTGYMYFETDTGWLYYDNGTNYVYVAGVDKGTDATRTSLIIGANDNGAVFYTTDTNVFWRVSAGVWTQMYVSLTAGVNGILGVANGGTGLGSGTSGGILGFTAAGALASSVLLAANALLLGGGVGTTPTALGSLGSTTTVLHGNAGGAPSFAAVSLTADISGILAGANGGTNNGFTEFTGPASTLKTFTLPNAAATILTTNALVTIAQGGTGAATSQAAINALSQLTTNGDLLYHNGTNSTRFAKGTAGQRLEATASSISWQTPDGARAFHSVNQTITNATWTALAFNSERYDNGAMHDLVTNNSRLTVQKAGVYMVTAHAHFLANTTGRRAIRLFVNNFTEIAVEFRPAAATGTHTMNISSLYAFVATDYVEVSVYQDSGGNLDIQAAAASTPEFAMQWLGP